MNPPAFSTVGIDPAATTSDERTLAVLAHMLQLVGGWIGPLIIFIVKRQSRFVSFHALQVLLLQAVFLVAALLVVMAAIVAVVLGVITTASAEQHGGAGFPPFLLVLFPLFWLTFMGSWILKLVVAIVWGVKAGQGEWAEYPILGKWARQILNIGPGGSVA